MSNSAQVDGPVTVHGDGVSVTKEFADDADFPIPTIRFVVENGREESVPVTVIEAVPEGFAIDDLGFHPDYLGDHWTTEEDHATFEYDLPAAEDVETLYAVRIDDDGRAGEFMTEPTLEVPPLGNDDADGEQSGDETAGDACGSDGDSANADAAESDAEGGTDGPTEDIGGVEEKASLKVDIDSEAARAAGEEVPTIDLDGVDGDVEDTPMSVGPESGTVLKRLVDELQRTDIDAGAKALLREQLGLGLPSEADARIKRLQTRFEDLAAYTDSLEAFLDEEGTAQQVIEEYKTRIDALREDVADVRQHASENATDVEGILDDLASLEGHVAAVETRLDDVAAHTDELEASLSATDELLDDVEADLRDAEEGIASNAEDVSTVEDRVGDIEEEANAIDADVDDVEGRVTAVEEDLDALESRTDSVEDDLASVQSAASDNADEITDLDEYVREVESALQADVESLETVVSDVEGDVAEFAEWRAQLGEMFQ